MSGTLETIDGRPALRFERRLAHPVPRVWRAISEPQELRRWCPGVPVWDLRPGAAFTSEEGVGTGEVIAVDPPHLLAYRWEDDEFRFELRPVDGGCLLVFTHAFGDRGLAAQHAAGWEAYLRRLEVHLGGGHLSEEEAHEPVAELRRRYERRFGAGAAGEANGTLERTREGPRLRFRRRLPHPPERVWRAITEPEQLAAWFPDAIAVERWTVGARLRFDPGPGMGDPFHGEVLALEPGALLEFTWGPDVIRLEVEADGDGSVLTLLDTIDELGKAARDGAGWHVCLDRLELALAGAAAPWSTSERWRQVHPSYVERLGPEAATVGPPSGALD